MVWLLWCESNGLGLPLGQGISPGCNPRSNVQEACKNLWLLLHASKLVVLAKSAPFLGADVDGQGLENEKESYKLQLDLPSGV